ncbi:MATE family efflux transporter [Pseudohongiella sp. O18]|uniref:MATE family efflux transporter n=1 Tax=Pseudohongiella sp. O18 TaxID=2904248 RepID=UPI001EFF132A|nr:MATE family efflux transporter [Pseudohongiella sp. O18]
MSVSRNKRIAKNTLLLYFRQLLILFVSLYTVRVVLDVLGIENYGLFSVVAGLIALSGFLSGSLASATQRFFSYALGKKDKDALKKTFTTNILLYVMISIVAVIVLETAGLWFVNNQLEVPQQRIDEVRTLYQYSIIGFVASIFTSPFIAILIAHEDMRIYAYTSIVDVCVKLGVVFLLEYLPGDKLPLYGLLLACVACANAIVYILICLYKYEECQIKEFHWDSKLIKEILGFTSWTVFGQFTSVIRTHAVTVLLNQSFNPIVVASRTIAINVASRINLFSSNFNTGLYPPIVKSYAAGNIQDMFSLVSNGSKITFFLLWLFALPMIVEMDYILGIWLAEVPDHAVLFTQLALIESIIMSLSLPLTTAARATGKMRLYEVSLGSIQIGLFLTAWLVLTYGAPAYSVFLVAISANVLMFVVRLYIVERITGLSMRRYLITVLVPVAGIVLTTLLPVVTLSYFWPGDFLFVIALFICSMCLSIASMYYIGLDKNHRSMALNLVKKKLSLGTMT